MAFIGYKQVTATGNIQTQDALEIPAAAHGAMLQADGANIRYTMDPDGANPGPPPNANVGMLLVNGNPPEYFQIDDLRKIQFVAASGSPKLNVHYVGA